MKIIGAILAIFYFYTIHGTCTNPDFKSNDSLEKEIRSILCLVNYVIGFPIAMLWIVY